MSEQKLENEGLEVPEIPEIIEKVVIFVLEETKEKMLEGEEPVPFTALVVKENLFLENHPGESAEECFAFARHTVEGARGADAYAFCYDGYIETDAGTVDALIAESGLPGEDKGIAVGYLYTYEEEKPVFEGEPVYIGEADNLMAALKESTQYADTEIDDRYLNSTENVTDEGTDKDPATE